MIRPRTRADLPALERALREVHEADGYPSVWPADPRAFLAPPSTFGEWVAEVRGKAVGQVVLRPVPEQVPGWVRASGLPVCEVLILSRLYEAEGWRRVGTLDGDWREPDGNPPRVHVYVSPAVP